MENKEICNSKYRKQGVFTGFVDIDKRTSGFHNAEFIVLASRVAIGKSTLALNIAEYVTKKDKVPTLVITLEGLPYKIANTDLLFIQKDLINISEIVTKCREMKKDKNIGLVIIDYLQLIKLDIKKEHYEQEISYISLSLKKLAKELDIPIILLSQLSRELEKREEKRPKLTDFQSSRAVVQDADTVIFLYREDYYNKKTENKNIVEVIFAKHRETGTERLLWNDKEKRFIDISDEKGKN